MPPQQTQQQTRQPQKEQGLFRKLFGRTATKGSGQQQKTALRPSQEASKVAESTTGQSGATAAGGGKTPEQEKRVKHRVSVRNNFYAECRSKMDEWKKAKNKHSLIEPVTQMEANVKSEDEAVANAFDKEDRQKIMGAAPSEQVAKDIGDLSEVVSRKFAAKQEVRELVKNHKSVYDMVMHVGEVGNARRELYAQAMDSLQQKNQQALDQKQDEGEKENLRKQQEENKEADLEKEVQALKQAQTTPKKHEKARQNIKRGLSIGQKVGGFLLKIEEWTSNIFSNYSDIKDCVSDRKSLDKKLAELKNCNKINANPPKIQGLEFGVSEGLGCGLAAFNVVKTIIEMIMEIVSVVKNKALMDRQEKVLRIRGGFDKILDLIGGIVDGAGPFISMVPFLGTCISLLQNAGGVAKASMEVFFAGKYRMVVSDSMVKLKNRLKNKREKLEKREESKADAALFTLDDFSQKGILNKRRELLSKVGAQMQIAKSDEEVAANQYQGRNAITRFMNRVDTGFLHRKHKENAATGFSAVNQKLAEHMWRVKKEEREKAQNNLAGAQPVAYNAAYKSKIHAMEALDILNEYEVENELAHRQNLKLRSNGFDSVNSTAKLAGNVIKLSGEICAATGVGAAGGGGLVITSTVIKTVAGLAEVSKKAGGLVNSRLEKHSQRGKNKVYVRNEMGTALYEKMDVLASIMKENENWITGSDEKAGPDTKDYVISKVKNDFDYIVGVRRGSDMKVSSIRSAESREEIIASLSAAFSQEGN